MGYRVGTRTMGTVANASALDMPNTKMADEQFTSTYRLGFVKGKSLKRNSNIDSSTLRNAAMTSLAVASMNGMKSQIALSRVGEFGSSKSQQSSENRPNSRQVQISGVSHSSSAPNLTPGGSVAKSPSAVRPPSLLGFRPREARRALLETLADPMVEETAKEVFKQHDVDNSEGIEPHELLTVLHNLHQTLGLGTPDDDTVDRLFKRFDLDNNRKLEFHEFFDLFIAELRRSAFDRSTLFGREFFVTKQSGRPWDTFERIKELGAGSFGTAYLCKHRLTQEDYVVKAVKKSRAKIPVEDIEKEIMVMRQVDHPHLVRLFEWYEDQGRIYLVLDALKGGTLKDVIMEFQRHRRGLKEHWSRSVARQCMEALSYCHNLRLIHKDIKDENIMLLQRDPNFDKPFVVLIDLGIAEMFSLSDPTGQECGGTPTTMAPEVWEGNFGPKCDVFSLGCVLFEMLAGSMPFIARSMKPVLWIRLHKKGPDYSLIKTSGSSKELCQKMLLFNDEERPSMTDCLKHQWFKDEDISLATVPPQQFMSLQAFCHQAALKRTLLLEIAARLPIARCGEIVELFEAFDTDRDGTLTSKELQAAFKQIGITDKNIINKMFSCLDVDNDGFLSFSEFAAGVLSVYGELVQDRLHVLFKEADTDCDGLLNRDEAQELLANAAILLKKDAKSRSTAMLQELLTKGETKIKYEDIFEKLLGFKPPSSSTAKAP